MKNTTNNNGQSMHWQQSEDAAENGSLKFELHAGDTVRGTLLLSGAPMTNATGEFTAHQGEVHVLLTTQGMVGTHVSIVDSVTKATLGALEQNWPGNRGKLQLADGLELGWLQTSFWKANFAFEDKEQHQYIRFISTMHAKKFGAHVEIDESAAQLPSLLTLVALGFFLVVLTDRGAAAVRPL